LETLVVVIHDVTPDTHRFCLESDGRSFENPVGDLLVSCQFRLGALISLLTGRNALYSGTRQLAFGLVAAGITYRLGHLIGAAVS
jgi:hypothetical protein